MSATELVRNKEERHNITFIFRGATGEGILIHKGEQITEHELNSLYPIEGKVGEASYKDENPDKTHVK